MYDGRMTVESVDAVVVKAPRMLTIAEACAAMRVSKSTLYEMFKAGQLSWVPVGRTRRVPAYDVEHYIERHLPSSTDSVA